MQTLYYSRRLFYPLTDLNFQRTKVFCPFNHLRRHRFRPPLQTRGGLPPSLSPAAVPLPSPRC